MFPRRVVCHWEEEKEVSKIGLFSANADDLVVILAPSVKDLEEILNLCYIEAKNISLNFTIEISICIKFCKNKIFKHIYTAIFLGSGVIHFLITLT